MPRHHVRGGAVVEVGEVHIFLVVEQGQVDDVAVISPRAKYYVALLLLLNSEDVKLGSVRKLVILHIHYIHMWTSVFLRKI